MLKNSYATGTVNAPATPGGFIGNAGNVVVENSYWDTESSLLSNEIGEWLGTPGMADVMPKTTVEMKATALLTALNLGGTVWKLNAAENDGYPSFIASNLAVKNNGALASQVNVYPNTFDTEIQIISENPLKGYAIYDLAGKTMQAGSLEGKQVSVNTEKIQSGVYVLQIETNFGVISKKIIK